MGSAEIFEPAYVPAYADPGVYGRLKMLVDCKKQSVQISVVPGGDPTGNRLKAEATLSSDGKWIDCVVRIGDSYQEFKQEACHLAWLAGKA